MASSSLSKGSLLSSMHRFEMLGARFEGLQVLITVFASMASGCTKPTNYLCFQQLSQEETPACQGEIPASQEQTPASREETLAIQDQTLAS